MNLGVREVTWSSQGLWGQTPQIAQVGALVPLGTGTLEREEGGPRTWSRGICGNVKNACLSEW